MKRCNALVKIKNQLLVIKKGTGEFEMKKILLIVMALLLTFLGACSSKETTSTAKSSSGDSEDKKVQKIIVGTGTQFPNICFLDKHGKLTGYDVELVRQIDEKFA